MESRLLKDDTSAVQWLDYFTAAQISEILRHVNEKGDCPNATAELMEYKQKKYPETDAFEEFVLEW